MPRVHPIPQSMPDGDAIHLQSLVVTARVGVAEAERARPQRLLFSITLWPVNQFDTLEDDLERTIDYAAVAQVVRAFVQRRCDQLIETIATALAAHLLESFQIRAVRIELRKFVIPESDYVAVIVTREQSA